MAGKRVLMRKFLRNIPSRRRAKEFTYIGKVRINRTDWMLQTSSVQRMQKRKRFSIKDKRVGVKSNQSGKDVDTVGKKVNVMDRISQLPDPIIHHILSFLCTKDAGRTSILSKRWRSIWASFPILDFDQRNFSAFEGVRHGIGKLLMPNKFINFVDYSLQSRCKQNLSVQKFRLYVTSCSSTSALHVDRWIGIATESNVKELDIEVRDSNDYSLPQNVLAAKTITALRLYGCKLNTCNAIMIPFLRKINLGKLRVCEQIFQDLVRSCPLIEDLRLVYCRGLKNLQVSTLLKLNCVELHKCRELKRVDIVVPNLETFWYYGKKSVPCKINLAACSALKRLTLDDGNMTNEWFQNQISHFPALENLVLSRCNVLKSVEISSEQLKRLCLRRCKNLEEVVIDAPNLLSFEYEGDKIPFSSMDPSCLQEAKLSFEPVQKDEVCFCLTDLNTLWYAKLRVFLGKFNCSLGLKLVVRYNKNVIIHEELREILLPPLHGLKLEIIKSSMSFEDLVDNVLQTCRPESLSIVLSSWSKVKQSMYEKMVDREENPSCCKFYLNKCWQHYLEDIKIENFEEAENKRTSDWIAWLKSCTAQQCQTYSFRLKWKTDQRH